MVAGFDEAVGVAEPLDPSPTAHDGRRRCQGPASGVLVRGLLLPSRHRGAHEKGGAEGRPTPPQPLRPRPESRLAGRAERDGRPLGRGGRRAAGPLPSADRRRVLRRGTAVAEALLAEPFETGRLFVLRVDRYSQISVRTSHYSVPVRLIGRRVRVMLHASDLVVYDDGVEVARHERLMIIRGASGAGPLSGGAGPQTRGPARVDRAETGVGVRLSLARARFADTLGARCHDVSRRRRGRILKIANRWLRWLEFPVQVASRTRGGSGRGWHPLGTGSDLGRTRSALVGWVEAALVSFVSGPSRPSAPTIPRTPNPSWGRRPGRTAPCRL